MTSETSGAGMGVAAGIVCSNAGVGAGRGASSGGGGINVTVAGTSGADSKEAGIIAGNDTGFNSITGSTFSLGGITTTGDWVVG